MYLSKKHLSRRTVLQGAGAAISLPLLDAMIPAHTAWAQTAANIKPRLGFVYFPHGAVQQYWTPKGAGKDFQLSPILKPLEGMRDYVTVVSGLRNKPGESSNPHGIIESTWLVCKNPDDRSNSTPNAGMSIDQIAAKQIGQDTPLSTLELCGEPGGSVNFRQGGGGLPLENNPRKVFFSMYGQGDSNADRMARLKFTGSILDYVHESSKSLAGKLGPVRSRAGRRLPGISARSRKPRAEADGQGRQPGQSARCAARRAGRFRRTAGPAVRDDCAGLANRTDAHRIDAPDAGSHDAHLPVGERRRSLPSAVAPRRGSVQARKAHQGAGATRPSASTSSSSA